MLNIIKSKRFMSVVLCCILMFSVTFPTFAAVNEDQTMQIKVAKQKVAKANLDRTRRTLVKYVKRLDDGTFQMNIPESFKKNGEVDSKSINDTISDGVDSKSIDATISGEVDSKSIDATISGMNFINSLIKEGTLKSTTNLQVYDPNDKSLTIQYNNNGIWYSWWGFEIKMGSTLSNKLGNLLVAGAILETFVAGVTAVISGPASLFPLACASIMGLTAATIFYYNSAGNGIWIDFNNSNVIIGIGEQWN